MSTVSVFSTGDAVSWRLDGVKFKTIPGLSPWTPFGSRAMASEGNENSIFNNGTALQYFPGKNPAGVISEIV